jgi:CMP/dCMP kinase
VGDKCIVVAIDGPAGAGKSTIARRVANKLGYVYIDTGAMYRAITLWALRLGVALDDIHRLEQLAKEARIELGTLGDNSITLNGEDVTTAIRDPAVSQATSMIAAVPQVRRALLRIQRGIAQDTSIVMEGRDIGSVVFPNAQVKIFLDARPEERARRRALELQEQGKQVEMATVAAEQAERDRRDRSRQEAPLVQAPDAQFVDTTGLSLDAVEEAILKIVRSRISNGKQVK